MQQPKSKIQNARSFAALRQFVRAPTPAERCDMCSVSLAEHHQHLIEPATRRLLCCCDACAILFSSPESAQYRRVPRRVRQLGDFAISDAQWDNLLIPINLAFFFRSTPAQRVIVLYPSPAGATESLLDLSAWEELAEANPILGSLEADVEALLVNRVGGARQYYIVPIDACYQLVGLIRTYWRGLSGGSEVWEEIGRFFDRLNERA